MKIKKVLRDKVLRGVTNSGEILIFSPPIPLVPVVGGGWEGGGGEPGIWGTLRYMGDTWRGGAWYVGETVKLCG